MTEKLKDSRGESLVEVLACVLVCTPSIALLFGSVMSSGNIGLQAQSADKEYYEALSKAERQAETDSAGADGSLTVRNADGPSKTIPNIRFYGSERLLSYAAAPEGEAEGSGS